MIWREVVHRLTLLELLVQTRLKRRKGQAEAYDWLASLPWTQATGRRDELALVEDHRTTLVTLLDRVWVDWRRTHLHLLEAGLPPTPQGWRRLGDLRRAEELPPLPEQVSRHTAMAVAGPGAKASLTASRREAIGDHEITHDGVVRVRAPNGLVIRRGAHSVAVDNLVTVLGELGLSDRAFRGGLTLEGDLDAILFVENLGPWRDMVQPDGWLLAYIPGWNTKMATALVAAAPQTRVIHFGDLDPNGVRIYQHLRGAIPELGWLVPDLWRTLVPDFAQRRSWPDDLDLSDTPELVRYLAATGRWMEQERLAVDPRLEAVLRTFSDGDV